MKFHRTFNTDWAVVQSKCWLTGVPLGAGRELQMMNNWEM